MQDADVFGERHQIVSSVSCMSTKLHLPIRRNAEVCRVSCITLEKYHKGGNAHPESVINPRANFFSNQVLSAPSWKDVRQVQTTSMVENMPLQWLTMRNWGQRYHDGKWVCLECI